MGKEGSERAPLRRQIGEARRGTAFHAPGIGGVHGRLGPATRQMKTSMPGCRLDGVAGQAVGQAREPWHHPSSFSRRLKTPSAVVEAPARRSRSFQFTCAPATTSWTAFRTSSVAMGPRVQVGVGVSGERWCVRAGAGRGGVWRERRKKKKKSEGVADGGAVNTFVSHIQTCGKVCGIPRARRAIKQEPSTTL